LLGRNVHIVDFFSRKFGYFVSSSARHTLVYKASFFVERLVSLRDYESVLFVRGKVIDVVGSLARSLVYFSVSRLDKAVLVYFRVSRQRRDKTYVLSFGSLYRTHSAVVRIVYVTNFERRSLSIKSARSQRREFSLVRKFRDRVGLIHKLRKLRRTEEFLNRARNGSYVYESARRNVFRVLRGHSFFYYSLESVDTYSELVL